MLAGSWLTLELLCSFGGDFLAGLTVASMLIPQSVSYATSLAKLSPVTGLVRLPDSCWGMLDVTQFFFPI